MQLKKLVRVVYYSISLLLGLTSLSMAGYSRLVVTSMVKCGTHLLTQAVSLLTGRKKVVFNNHLSYIQDNTIPTLTTNQYLQNHVAYTPRAREFFIKNKFKVLYIYRDPRDQVVSRAYWILAKPQAHPEYRDYSTVADLLTHLIPRVELAYRPFMGWMYDEVACAVRFEDLVGPKGGGDIRAQVSAIKKMARYLGISLTQPLLMNCLNNVFGGKRETFRQGQIGSWKQHFTPEHKKLFKEYGSALLKELGYEPNNNW